MNKIIYIHGFASSGESFKGNLLREVYGERVLTPSLLSKPSEDLKTLNTLISRYDYPVLVGSSLGGFFAEYFSRTLDLKALLINPLTCVEDIKPYIGQHEYFDTGKGFTFTGEDYNTLLEMAESMKSAREGKRSILVAEDDEVIPFNKAVKHFDCENEKVKIFKTGGHSFNCECEIMNNLKLLLL